MTRTLLLGALLALSLRCAAENPAENPAGIPADYRLQYSADFSKPESIKAFLFTDPKVWKLSDEDGKPALELLDQSKYTPAFRSPFNIALLAGKAFGDVIIEADCLQTSKEYGHRDMTLIYGFQDPTHFYYTHIATSPDDHAHNCFIVNAAPRVKFATEVSKGVDWGQKQWHHVRLHRKASDGTVRVFFDDMTTPIMTGTDKTFGAGAVGFGSFDDTGKAANFKVWSPASEDKATVPFPLQ